jgi:hypothetical protein
MSSIRIKLKRVGDWNWRMFTPKGHQIGPTYRGDRGNAIDWAQAFVSSWSNWVVYLDEEEHEKTDRVPE